MCITTSVSYINACENTQLYSNNLAPLSGKIDLSSLDENRFRNYLRNGGIVDRKLQIVVPASQELYNGNLIRLINSMSNQSVKNAKNFEMLIIINNTKDISDDTSNPVFIENQLTIKMLEYLNGNTSETDFLNNLPSTIKSLFFELSEKMNKNKMNIRIMDLSTQGQDKFNIGRIRNTGVKELINDYLKSNIDTVIAMMDADVICPNNYAENIFVNFITHGTKSLLVGIEYEIFEAFNLDHFKHTSADRYPMFWMFFSQFLENNSPYVGSPQIVASASTFNDVKGVPEISYGEDYVLASKFFQKGLIKWDLDAIVKVSDRIKKDGFGASGSRYTQMQEKKKTVFHDPLNYFLQQAYNICAKSFNYELQEILNEITEDISYEELNEWKPYLNQEKQLVINRNDPQNYQNELFQKDVLKLPTYRYLKKALPKNELDILHSYMDFLENKHETKRKKLINYAKTILARYLNKQQLFTNKDPFEIQEFFQTNSWVLDEITKLLKTFPKLEMNNFNSILSYLENEFPDYFAPYNKAYAKQHANFLFALERLFMDAEINPEMLPKSNQIFEIFKLFFNKKIIRQAMSGLNKSA